MRSSRRDCRRSLRAGRRDDGHGPASRSCTNINCCFGGTPIFNCDEAKALVNKVHFGTFFHAMLNEGVYLAPSAFEAAFVSTMHDDEILEATDRAMGNAMQVVREVSR